MSRFHPRVLLLALLLAPACHPGAPLTAGGSGPATGFAHLVRRSGGFESTHGLPYRFVAAASLTAAGPLHRTDRFHDVPYEISLAAFVCAETAFMVHAERVADRSGASNYDGMKPSSWPDARFRTNGPTCMTVQSEERDEEFDLRWLQANGFDPTGTLAVQQFFASTPDHNDEIVLTLMRHVAACDGSVAQTAVAQIQALATVAPSGEAQSPPP